jgi:hypothetical protein
VEELRQAMPVLIAFQEEITQKIEEVDAKRAMIKEYQRALTSKDYERCEQLIQCLWKESEE